MGKFIDLTGQRFGRWTVLERVPNKGRKTIWLCQCDCGTEKVVGACELRVGKSKSCGCLHRELSSELLNNQLIKQGADGRSKTRLYRIWKHMKQRCNRESNADYSRYGGRGIRVCAEWEKDFFAFQSWALSHGYSDSLTIDRIDNDGDYSPENCRWVDIRIQCNNKSNNILIEYQGNTRTLTEWAQIAGISKQVIRYRLNYGWPIERALKTPVKPRKKKI